MSQHDAVVFDLFGTLVPPFSMLLHGDVMQEMSEVLGLPRDDFEHEWIACYEERRTGMATVPQQIRDICRLLGRAGVSESTIDEAIEVRLRFFRPSLVPRPGAVAVLELLRDRGLKLGLVSDTSSETCTVWPTTPFAPLIDVAVFSCEAGCHKPDRKIYRAAWEGLGVDPRRCLYVGDGMSQELSGARGVGMEAVHLSVVDEYDPLADEIEPWVGPTIFSLESVLELVRDR